MPNPQAVSPVWTSGVRFMKNIPFANRALLSCLVSLLPLAKLGAVFYATQSDAVAVSKSELVGLH